MYSSRFLGPRTAFVLGSVTTAILASLLVVGLGASSGNAGPAEAAISGKAGPAGAAVAPPQAPGAGMNAPIPGLHAYTNAHAAVDSPPDRLGGPMNVTVTQEDGSTRLVLPGPRFLDPSVFGKPGQPVGMDPAPFPLLGVPTDLRNTADGQYTFADRATPFSDWRVVGTGDVRMELVDHTAIDGARTRDEIDFEAEFEMPDGSEFQVTVNRPLSHGMAYPFFGGVVTNHLLHGATGIGTRLMPTEFTYAAFWGVGNITKDGEVVNENHLIHVMVTEIVRGDDYKLAFDGGVGDPPGGVTMHLMIPPFRPDPEQGLVNAPVMTGFMPFPHIQERMQEAMQQVQQLPEAQRQQRMARMQEIRTLMQNTRQHVEEETQAGRWAGMPFIHIMFGNIEMEAS